MTSLDFDSRGRAHVSEQEFMDYLAKTSYSDDYTKEMQLECQIEDKD